MDTSVDKEFFLTSWSELRNDFLGTFRNLEDVFMAAVSLQTKFTVINETRIRLRTWITHADPFGVTQGAHFHVHVPHVEQEPDDIFISIVDHVDGFIRGKAVFPTKAFIMENKKMLGELQILFERLKFAMIQFHEENPWREVNGRAAALAYVRIWLDQDIRLEAMEPFAVIHPELTTVSMTNFVKPDIRVLLQQFLAQYYADILRKTPPADYFNANNFNGIYVHAIRRREKDIQFSYTAEFVAPIELGRQTFHRKLLGKHQGLTLDQVGETLRLSFHPKFVKTDASLGELVTMLKDIGYHHPVARAGLFPDWNKTQFYLQLEQKVFKWFRMAPRVTAERMESTHGACAFCKKGGNISQFFICSCYNYVFCSEDCFAQHPHSLVNDEWHTEDIDGLFHSRDFQARLALARSTLLRFTNAFIDFVGNPHPRERDKFLEQTKSLEQGLLSAVVPRSREYGRHIAQYVDMMRKIIFDHSKTPAEEEMKRFAHVNEVLTREWKAVSSAVYTRLFPKAIENAWNRYTMALLEYEKCRNPSLCRDDDSLRNLSQQIARVIVAGR